STPHTQMSQRNKTHLNERRRAAYIGAETLHRPSNLTALRLQHRTQRISTRTHTRLETHRTPPLTPRWGCIGPEPRELRQRVETVKQAPPTKISQPMKTNETQDTVHSRGRGLRAPWCDGLWLTVPNLGHRRRRLHIHAEHSVTALAS